ncbi:MAG: PDZ domain-containing protein [Gammaproteobacteria bacterium]|nr:PDZ domain-containing protein [Gammaproteobacteria bacterium]
MKKTAIYIAALISLSACQLPVTPQGGMHTSTSTPHKMNMQHWKNDHIDEYQIPITLDLSAVADLDQITPELLGKRVVFVGESHDRYEHHLNQLEIIRRLYNDNPRLAIGMEFFQQPFQPYLDAFIAGEINEKEFLKKSEYYKRWRIDYRHYRPIILFAKKHAIPLLALDILEETARKVGKDGIENLDEDAKKHLPSEIVRTNTDYSDMLQAIFKQHPNMTGQAFERFMDVQLVRDESMAENAVKFLQKHPDHRMVILAGSGHIAYGHGIPDRLIRRMDIDTAIVLNGMGLELTPDLGDYILLSKAIQLPKAGLMGVILDTNEKGVVKISGFGENSPAKRIGIKIADQLIQLDDQDVTDLTDVKYTLLDKIPGDKVNVKVQRKNWLGDNKEMQFMIELH